jgi:hypothetical protein
MATPPPPTPHGGNGERLSGTIAGHTFALNTRDLISVLLLVGIFILGWTVWQGQRAAMRLLYDGQLVITKRLEEQDDHLREQTQQIIRFFYALEFNMSVPPEKRVPLHLYSPESHQRGP